MTDQERTNSINMASSAQGRLLTAWPLILFGVAEQLVYLLLTVAQGITFLSFGIAILFAFFKKTEVIARSIVDLWIELIVQTVVIALIQSLVVTFFLAGTASDNGVVVLGVGLICLIFMMIVLWSGVKAVWNSVNRLFKAFGQATGGVIVSPGAAATVTALGAAGAGAALLSTASSFVAGTVSVGSNALAGMSALQQGATPAQAAGLVLGEYQPLVGAARTLAYLPGVRGTDLGDAAGQFAEGALTRRVASSVPLVGRVTGPLVGAMLLTDRDPEAAEYDKQGRVLSRPMLVPAVADSLSKWTLPRTSRTSEASEDTNADFSPIYGLLILGVWGCLPPSAMSPPIKVKGIPISGIVKPTRAICVKRKWNSISARRCRPLRIRRRAKRVLTKWSWLASAWHKALRPWSRRRTPCTHSENCASVVPRMWLESWAMRSEAYTHSTPTAAHPLPASTISLLPVPCHRSWVSPHPPMDQSPSGRI